MATTSGCSTNQLPFLDRVAIVTGASRGIGKAIALHLASLGAKLVINYTSPSSQPLAKNIVTQINSLSNAPRAVEFRADVSDPAQVKALFDTAQEAFQAQPHIFISNAGITPDKPSTIANTAVSDFDRVDEVNARGTFLCIKEAANRIKRGGGGRIVTVSSSQTATFLPSSVAYTASKAAVEAMTKVLAKELRRTGITANWVAPGPTMTDMMTKSKRYEEIVERVMNESPFERLGEVEDVAPFVGFLVSDAGEWVNGQVIRVNGGYV